MTLRLGALGLLCREFLGTDGGTCPPLVVGGDRVQYYGYPPLYNFCKFIVVSFLWRSLYQPKGNAVFMFVFLRFLWC